MWTTGNFIKLMKANSISPEGFTAAWSKRTALYLSDIENVPAKMWKKIVMAAMKIVEKKGPVLRPAVQALAAKPPPHHLIVDADESD
jgi:hypothetical protein